MVSAAVLSALALILVTAVCWHYRKERPYCLVGWLWFISTLVPVIGIVQVGEQAMAERYSYVPFIGLFIAVVWLIGDAVANSPKIRVVTQLLAVAVILACAVKTNAQVKVWKDTVMLFSHILEVDPRGEVPNLSLGVAYVRQGKIADAQPYLERALVYHPTGTLSLAYSALCIIRTTMQTHDASNMPLAGQRLELALSISPDDPDALSDMALWSSLMGKPKDEELYSRRAIASHPDFILAWLYLAESLLAEGRLNEAIEADRHALAMDPDNVDALNSLGTIFGKQGLKQEALKELRLSLASKPDQFVAHSKIGRILLENHQLPEAVGEYTQALQYDPGNASLHDDLGVALYQMGEYEKATEQFSDAVRIDPAFAGARQNLEVVQTQMKNKNGKK
jgi:tetratricopeptide (TPR) repeat protein